MESGGNITHINCGFKSFQRKNRSTHEFVAKFPNALQILFETTRVVSLPRQRPENVRHSYIASTLVACNDNMMGITFLCADVTIDGPKIMEN